MTKVMRFYKRLLDLSLFFSYILLILLLLLLAFSVSVGAINFSGPDTPIFEENFLYLRPIFLTFIALLVISVISARIFLGFVTKHEELETVEDYKRSLRNKRRDEIMNQLKMDVKKNTIEYNEEKYLTKKERKRRKIEENIIEDDSDEEIQTSAFEAIVADRGIRISDINEETDEEIEEVAEEETEEEIEEVTEVEDNQEVVDITNVVEPPEPLPIPIKKRQYYTRLTKSELVDIIADEIGVSHYRARKFVNGLLSIIQEELVEGNDVRIEDFGKFYKHFVKRHQAVDPRNGEALTVEEHYVAKFSPFKAFKDKITNDVVATNDRYLKTEEDQEEKEPVKENKQEVVEPQKEVKPLVVKKRKLQSVKRTKKDVIKYINNTTDLSMNKANKFLFGMQEVIKEALEKKEDVNIQGFGRFTTIHIPSKEAVNPATNEKMIVPEHDQIRLRFDEDFKSKIN